MTDALSLLLDDLAAEHSVLKALLRKLPEATWDRPSPAEGWTLRDCVVHLAETDSSATNAALQVTRTEVGGVDEPGTVPVPRTSVRGTQDPSDVLTPAMKAARSQPPSEIFERYCSSADRLVEALRAHEAGDRLPWAGRQMGVVSFTSARLMEHWSHGLDIHDAAGVPPIDTDRLRHVAHLGYITRDFAYRTRGLKPPSAPLYVELVAPSGDVWRWGPESARDRITGPAGDFCRVVTQRIHWSDTDLVAEGSHAQEFLRVAQAFAGPPCSGRAPKG